MQKEGKTYSIHLLSKDGKSTVEPPPMSEIVLPPLHSNSKRRMYLPDALPRARTLQSMCTAGATTTATAYDDDDNSAKAASPLLRRLPPAERNDDHAPPEESPGDGALTAEEAAKPVPSSPSLLVSCSDGSGSSVSPPLRRTGRSSSLPQIGPILLRQDSLHVEKKLERRGSILSMLAGGLVWKSQSSLSSEEDDGQASSSEGSSAGSVGSNDPRGPANDESIRMVCEYALFNVPVDLSKPLHARSPSMGPLSPMLHGSGGGRRMQQEVPPGAEEPICLPLCDCDLDHVPVEEIELVAWMKAMYKDIFHRSPDMKTFQGRMCLWSMDAQDKQDVYRWFVEHVQAADAGGSDLEEEQDHAAAARMHDHIVIEFNHKDMEFLFYTPVHERFLDHAAETMKPRVVGLERYLGILSNASLLIACRARKVAQKHWCTRRRSWIELAKFHPPKNPAGSEERRVARSLEFAYTAAIHAYSSSSERYDYVERCSIKINDAYQVFIVLEKGRVAGSSRSR